MSCVSFIDLAHRLCQPQKTAAYMPFDVYDGGDLCVTVLGTITSRNLEDKLCAWYVHYLSDSVN